MEKIDFSRFLKYDELTALVKAFAAEYPELVRLESIGKTYEQRDIWALTITNFATGKDTDKPALLIDGNIHAPELSGSGAAIYFIDFLLKNYGKDEDVTRCLDTRVYYIVPRTNPDGAELALNDPYRIIRSCTRPYPYDEEQIGGLVIDDVDKDGRILMMRVPDPNGAWKICEKEPRIMERRGPTEYGGQYYRLLREGYIDNYDGYTYSLQDDHEMLDMNRNFPHQWRPEKYQQGAGNFPLSESETYSLVNFIRNHPNITSDISLHTHSGALLRPFGDKPDSAMPLNDLYTYQKIGQKGTEISGYPAVSTFSEFNPSGEINSGTYNCWSYEERGVFSWTVEIWNPFVTAGIDPYSFSDWEREHPIEDDIKMLKWSDENLDGQGYIDWYPFDHPQLGKVEIGGLNRFFWYSNPPAQFREKEFAKFPRWFLYHLLISPKLELHEAKAEPLGDGKYLIRMVVQNSGWLPTYVTKVALNRELARGLVAEIELPEGAQIITGKRRYEEGHLEGRAYTPANICWWRGTESTDHRKVFTWVVSGSENDEVKVKARIERAGYVEAVIRLKG